MLDGNDKGRSSGIVVCQVEARVVEGDKETNDDCASDIEHKDTEIDTSDGLGQITSWVFCFACSDLGVV